MASRGPVSWNGPVAWCQPGQHDVWIQNTACRCTKNWPVNNTNIRDHSVLNPPARKTFEIRPVYDAKALVLTLYTERRDILCWRGPLHCGLAQQRAEGAEIGSTATSTPRHSACRFTGLADPTALIHSRRCVMGQDSMNIIRAVK